MNEELLARYPATFGLKAHKGVFRINPFDSYINDSGIMEVVLQIQNSDKWLYFCRDSESVFAKEVVR